MKRHHWFLLAGLTIGLIVGMMFGPGRSVATNVWHSYAAAHADNAYAIADKLVSPHYAKPWKVVNASSGELVAIAPNGDEVRFNGVIWMYGARPKYRDEVYLTTSRNDSWTPGNHVRVYSAPTWKKVWAEWQENVKPHEVRDSLHANLLRKIERGEMTPRSEAP